MNGRPSSKKFLGARSGGFAVVAVLTFLFPLGAVAQNGNWNPQDILAAKEWVAISAGTRRDAAILPSTCGRDSAANGGRFLRLP